MTSSWLSWLAVALVVLPLLAWAAAPAVILTRPVRAQRVRGWSRGRVIALWAVVALSWSALAALFIADWNLELEIDGLLELMPWLLAVLLAYTLVVTVPVAAITVTLLRRRRGDAAAGRPSTTWSPTGGR